MASFETTLGFHGRRVVVAGARLAVMDRDEAGLAPITNETTRVELTLASDLKGTVFTC